MVSGHQTLGNIGQSFLDTENKLDQSARVQCFKRVSSLWCKKWRSLADTLSRADGVEGPGRPIQLEVAGQSITEKRGTLRSIVSP